MLPLSISKSEVFSMTAIPKARKAMSCKSAAETTETSQPFWRKLIAQRRIEVIRLGRAVRIPVEEIDRIMREGTVPAREAK